MKRIVTCLILLCIILASKPTEAQRWKRYRHEAWGGIGATNFLGELGGGAGAAKDLILDFDGKSSRYIVTGGYRYKLNEVVSARGGLAYASLYGSDEFSGDPWRRSRNLHFRSMLIELTAMGEVFFIREKTSNRYRVRGIRGAIGSGLSAYVCAGLGGMFFNPKAKFVGNAAYPGDNKWHALQPLATEGQGLANGPKKYSRINMCIPMGIGAKFSINRNMSLSLEYGFRFTFTDYMDDVSGVYYDPAVIEAAGGPAAAYFSNPSIVVENPDPEGGPIRAGGARPHLTSEQRGDATTNDTYMFAVIAFNYKFTSKKANRPKF